jgi:hypothetical protein
MKLIWKFLTSLRLTVVLLALAVLLIFFGTLAQVDEGLWRSQKIWFESWLVTNQHLRLFGVHFWVPIFPGGYLIGNVLFASLLAAFIHRFSWRWDKAGIHLTHGGVILLLLGQLLTQEFALESYIEFKEGETKNYAEHHRHNELAFMTDSGNGQEEVVVIPETMLKTGAEIRHEKLPFAVRVKEYRINSTQPRRRGPAVDGASAATQGFGPQLVIDPRPEATDMDSRNLPYAYIELLDGSKSLGTWLVTPWLHMLGAGPQEIDVAGRKVRTELRFERYYQPYNITLLDTSQEQYRGTDIPKNFRSRVRVVDTDSRESREVDIYMNHPLRYAGQTFYQARMGRDPEDPQKGTSALQVVSNPSWLAPYFGCYIVAIGMYMQFRHHLVIFLRKRLGTKPGGFGSWAARIAEFLVLGFAVLKFTLYLFGYSLTLANLKNLL